MGIWKNLMTVTKWLHPCLLDGAVIEGNSTVYLSMILLTKTMTDDFKPTPTAENGAFDGWMYNFLLKGHRASCSQVKGMIGEAPIQHE